MCLRSRALLQGPCRTCGEPNEVWGPQHWCKFPDGEIPDGVDPNSEHIRYSEVSVAYDCPMLHWRDDNPDNPVGYGHGDLEPGIYHREEDCEGCQHVLRVWKRETKSEDEVEYLGPMPEGHPFINQHGEFVKDENGQQMYDEFGEPVIHYWWIWNNNYLDPNDEPERNGLRAFSAQLGEVLQTYLPLKCARVAARKYLAATNPNLLPPSFQFDDLVDVFNPLDRTYDGGDLPSFSEHRKVWGEEGVRAIIERQVEGLLDYVRGKLREEIPGVFLEPHDFDDE